MEQTLAILALALESQRNFTVWRKYLTIYSHQDAHLKVFPYSSEVALNLF